jgi:hypothetical protein
MSSTRAERSTEIPSPYGTFVAIAAALYLVVALIAMAVIAVVPLAFIEPNALYAVGT